MIIEINDAENGKKRKALLMLKMMEYAKNKFKTQEEIAEFCGICPRTLRKYFAYYPELKYGKNFDKKNISNYVNFLRDTAGFKFAEDKEFFLKKQVDKFLKNNL